MEAVDLGIMITTRLLIWETYGETASNQSFLLRIGLRIVLRHLIFSPRRRRRLYPPSAYVGE